MVKPDEKASPGTLEGDRDSSDAVTRLLSQAVRRESFTDHNGRSGSRFEKAVLADGTKLVVKHISREWDWIMRATGDQGRAARLCLPGVLDRIAPAIDLAVLAVEPEGDGWVIAMRDVTDALIRSKPIGRDDNLRVLRATAEIHSAFWGERIDGLVSLRDRYALFSPWFRANESGPVKVNGTRGWEIFVATGPADIVQAIAELEEHPELLSCELDACEKTLIHGDLKLDNVGLLPDRVILLDWALAGMAPPEVEFAWYLMMNSGWIEGSLDSQLDDVHAVLADRFNPRAMELALTGVFVQWAPFLALNASGERPDRDQVQAQDQMEWWLRRVSRSLETWSPV